MTLVAGSVLRQPDSIGGMHLLELILAEEIEDRASGIALHGLRSDALDVDIAGQRGRAQQVLLAGKQHLGFVGAGAHLDRRLVSVDSAFTFPVASTRCTSLSGARKNVASSACSVPLWRSQSRHGRARLHEARG